MTKQSILMVPLFKTQGTATKISFVVDPYTIAEGAVRNIQKYCVILLTLPGSDTLRPTMGTYFANIPRMNIRTKDAMRLFIHDQVEAATRQFFSIQSDMSGLVDDDKLSGVEIADISFSTDNKITVILKFNTLTSEAVLLSLKV